MNATLLARNQPETRQQVCRSYELQVCPRYQQVCLRELPQPWVRSARGTCPRPVPGRPDTCPDLPQACPSCGRSLPQTCCRAAIGTCPRPAPGEAGVCPRPAPGRAGVCLRPAPGGAGIYPHLPHVQQGSAPEPASGKSRATRSSAPALLQVCSRVCGRPAPAMTETCPRYKQVGQVTCLYLQQIPPRPLAGLR